MILDCKGNTTLLFRFCWTLFFFSYQVWGLIGQPCEKNWMHYEHRETVSEEAFLRNGLRVPVEKIQIDFLGLPVGVRYHYTRVYQIGDRAVHKIKIKRTANVQTLVLLEQAYVHWDSMKQAAKSDAIHLKLNNSYRSYQTQKMLYQRLGKKIAESPGYSEHHLGTTIDLYKLKENSKEFLWLLRYAFDYGWVPSYYFRVEAHIKKEAWHWRYVGKLAAQKFRCAWEKEINQKIWRLKEEF